MAEKHTCYMRLAWVLRRFAQKHPQKMRVCVGRGGTKNATRVPNKRGGAHFSKKFPRGGAPCIRHIGVYDFIISVGAETGADVSRRAASPQMFT